MYIGASGGSATPESKPNGQPGSTPWFAKGSASRRFDKEASSKPATVRALVFYHLYPITYAPKHKQQQQQQQQAPLQILSGKEDEAAAMAAVFQLQSANWEETQEKMSQLVSPLGGSSLSSSSFSNALRCPFYHGLCFPMLQSDTDLYQPTWNGLWSRRQAVCATSSTGRATAPAQLCVLSLRAERYVFACVSNYPKEFCLTLVRGHWIQDCPTNNDREFDNKPRIKRTTGIPRSFLKAVDNPSGARIGQGVMVTPEGGYVVAQPDL